MRAYFISVIWPVLQKAIINVMASIVEAIMKDAFKNKPAASSS